MTQWASDQLDKFGRANELAGGVSIQELAARWVSR